MTLKDLCIIGSVSLGLLPTAGTAATLYETMRHNAELELRSTTVERAVAEFVVAVSSHEPIKVTKENLSDIVQGNNAAVCKPPISPAICEESMGRVRRTVNRVVRMRTLERDLAEIAGRYEVGMDGLSGREADFHNRLSGIGHMWASGVDEATLPVPHTKATLAPLPSGTNWEAAAEPLREVLSELAGKWNDADLYRALVERYKHGTTQIVSDENCEDGTSDASELGLLQVRHCSLESALTSLHKRILTASNIENDDVHFEPLLLSELNVLVWIRSDDIGLTWMVPLLSTPLQLTYKEQPVPGGTYPRAPQRHETRSICSHPLGNMGYLCRALEHERCKDTESDDVFSIVHCEPGTLLHPVQRTVSGPDVCTTGGWLNETDHEQPEECTDCDIQLSCENQCSGGSAVSMDPKDDSGILRVCLDTNAESFNPNSITKANAQRASKNIPAAYWSLFGAVLAQQSCNSAAGAPVPSSGEACCSERYFPSRVMCSAMADDGIFAGSEWTVEQCSAVVLNESCNHTCTYTDTAEAMMNLAKLAEANPANVHASCEAALEDPDARTERARASRSNACTPGCKANYESTIGNHMCFIGQCIEKSIEQHRLVPGRAPLTAGDSAFPWDACVPQEGRNHEVLTLPTSITTTIPPYEGYALIRSLDEEFCQLLGYPPLTPPALCGFSIEDQLATPLESIIATAENSLNQQEAYTLAVQRLERSMQNIAARMGTDLVLISVKHVGQHLGEIVSHASDLLREMGNISFPTQMCPRNGALSCEDLFPSEQ